MSLKDLKEKVAHMGILFSESLLALLIILECNSVYRCVSGRVNIVYNLQTMAILIALILILIFCWYDKKYVDVIFESSLLLCGLFIFVIIFLFFNAIKTVAVPNYMLNFLMFFPLMIIVFRIYRKKGNTCQLIYRFSDIICILAVTSLIIWILTAILGLLEPTGTILLDWGGEREAKNYYNLRFWIPAQKESLGFLNVVIGRNTGIFPESPMYNIFLVMSLYTEFFLRRKCNRIRIILFTVTILTTFGTLGIILTLVGYFLKFLSRVNIRHSRFILFFTLLCLGGSIILLIINKKTFGTSSFVTHIDDYVASFKAWLVAPVWGSGYDNELLIQTFMSPFRKSNLGLSNSLSVVLAEGGIILFLFYLVPFVALFKQYLTDGNKNIAYWAVGIFGLYATTIFHNRFLMIMFLAFGYSRFSIEHIPEEKSHSLKISLYEDFQICNTKYRNISFGKKIESFLIALSVLSCITSIFNIIMKQLNANLMFNVLNVLITVSAIILLIIISKFNEKESIFYNKKKLLLFVEIAYTVYVFLSLVKFNIFYLVDTFMKRFGLYLEESQWKYLAFITLILFVISIFIYGIKSKSYSK